MSTDGMAAEKVAAEFDVGWEEQDEYALRSHHRAGRSASWLW